MWGKKLPWRKDQGSVQGAFAFDIGKGTASWLRWILSMTLLYARCVGCRAGRVFAIGFKAKFYIYIYAYVYNMYVCYMYLHIYILYVYDTLIHASADSHWFWYGQPDQSPSKDGWTIQFCGAHHEVFDLPRLATCVDIAMAGSWCGFVCWKIGHDWTVSFYPLVI